MCNCNNAFICCWCGRGNFISVESRLDIETFVLAEYNGSWSRGKIYGMENNQAVVGFIDYGNLETKPVAELMPLPRQFSHFPAVAVCIHLEGITNHPDMVMEESAAQFLKVC